MNLNSTINFDFKYFWRWWLRELAFLVPEKIRKALSEKSGYLYISINDNSIRFYRMQEQEKQSIIVLDQVADLASSYQKILSLHPEFTKAHLVLRLEHDQALSKIIYLPLAAKENLRQVVAFEMDKFLPFTADQVYFDIKTIGRTQDGQLLVLLVVSPKSIMDKVIWQLREGKAFPEIIDFQGAPNDFDNDTAIYNLLPEWEKPVRNKLAQITHGFLGITLLMLVIAVLIFPVWHSEQTISALRERLSQVEKESRLVQTRQLEVDEIISETERLIALKNTTPSLLELLETLTKLVPDDTALTHLQYNDERLQIQGQSPAASALISLLEASPLFSNARFVSPLTQDRRTGLERFQLSVDIESVEDKDG